MSLYQRSVLYILLFQMEVFTILFFILYFLFLFFRKKKTNFLNMISVKN